ncbi:HAD family hydrolase [Comamonas jiangduensis]|uniref:HAD family hydrolase n=1 Tax=Comamonas jiangduensis TaxID=1194168 RepID=UPI0024E08A69|nr:HAD family hydrolase [Comamonas jiangduensis]
MLDPSQIRAVTLDLDDTLWPIWPTIRRAEEVLLLWLKEHAAQTAQVFSSPEALRAIRLQVERERPDLRHDMSGLRKASIAQALRQAGDDENLAIPAFEIFFAERQRVQLFDDALQALEFLAARWPVVAVTNGNADLGQIGLDHFFQDSFNVQRTGFAKPDVRIFDCAAQALQMPLSAILHVGDDAKLDAVAARDAGMHAVWLNRAGLDWAVEDQHPPTTVVSLLELCDLLAA